VKKEKSGRKPWDRSKVSKNMRRGPPADTGRKLIFRRGSTPGAGCRQQKKQNRQKKH